MTKTARCHRSRVKYTRKKGAYGHSIRICFDKSSTCPCVTVAPIIIRDLLFLNINGKYDLQDGDLLHNFADKLDVIVKLNVSSFVY
jgi:hypothetical protein